LDNVLTVGIISTFNSPILFNWPSTPQFGQPSKFAPAGRAPRAQEKKRIREQGVKNLVRQSVRGCPQALFFEHKNTKTHLSRPPKGTFSCFDLVSMCKVSGWLAHQKKTQYQKHSFFPRSEDFAAPSLEFSGNEFE
jgi:hypothetical protein